MTNRLPVYVRTLRRSHGLTQRELAFLCGMDGGTSLSRYERSVRDPSLAALLALSVVFGSSPATLFPGLHVEVSRMVMERAEELFARLQGNPRKVTAVKLDLLERLIDLQTRSHHSHL